MNKLTKFLESISEFDNSLEFQMLEIGAHPYGDSKEPFHQLLDFFPKSKVVAVFNVPLASREKR